MLVLLLACGSGDGGGEREVVFIDRVEDFTKISSDELNFGRSAETISITLSNNNYEFVRWRAFVDASWLSIEPTNGQLIPWGEESIAITVNRGTLTSLLGIGMVTIEAPAYEEAKYIRIWVDDQ